jgi:DNA-binding CsgD family transcriptional regulator
VSLLDRALLEPVAPPPASCHDPVVASARLIGRDEDVATIRDAVMSARTGEPRCVLVTGEAGIGKSRLVREALAGIDDALVVTGHGADMSTGEIPFGVLADSLRDLVHGSGVDALTPAEREALAPLLPGSVPAGHVERVQVLSAFLDLLQRLSSQRLLVWLVEDLHWADSATRDLVNLAVRTLRGRLLVVATVRTEDPERAADQEAALTSYVAGLARLPVTTVLPLGRLTSREVRAQLVDLVGSTLPPGVAARIEQLSDGVPFVVEELAAAHGRPELATASGVAASRLAGLSPDARRLVEAAAVGEGHLRISLLERVVDATPDELDVALAEAVRSGILVTDHTADAVSFRHALLRDAADRELGPGARRSWHRRWAEVLRDSPGVLAADPAALAIAEHWHHARDLQRAVGAAMAALPAATRIGDPRAETRLWTRVLASWASLDDPEALTGTTLRQAVADGIVAAQPGPLVGFIALLDAIPMPLLTEAEQAVVHVSRAITAEGKGELDRRFRGLVEDLFDRFDWFSAPRDLMSMHALTMATRLRRTDPRSELAMDLAAEIGRELPTHARIQEIMVRSHSREFAGDPTGAADYLDRELASLTDEPGELVLFLAGNLIWCRAVGGQHARAQQVGEDALGRLRRPQLSVALWEHLVENHSFSLFCTGDWAGARALLEEAAPWWEDDVRTSNMRLAALDLAQRGTMEESRWRALVGGENPGGAPQVMVRHLVAAADAAAGELGAAREMYAAMWADTFMVQFDDYLWRVLVDAARAEADAAVTDPARPDREAATAHLERLASVAEGSRRYGPLGEVWPLDLAAQLDRFHDRDPRPNLEAALAGWERIGHVPDVGVTHLSLAEAHATHGDRDAARHHLVVGREIADQLGARPMLARVDALAERFALTARDRRTSDVLTGRESEVLSLIAEGRTNAEIAATLFMSPKTASVHVSHIIAKLGAGNRTEAAAMARRQGLLQ